MPLLRAGFRPTGAYQVSFVVLNSESPLAKSGDAALTLPKMDLAIGQVKWEVFLPEQLKVSNFAGNIKLEQLFPTGSGDDEIASAGPMGIATNQGRFSRSDGAGLSGTLGGTVVDQQGASVPRAVVSVIAGGRSYSAVSGPDGRWSIPNVPSGNVSIRVNAPGFKSHMLTNIPYDSSRGTVLNQVLEVGALTQAIEVAIDSSARNANKASPLRQISPAQEQAASSNVGELQRKVVGVLPIAISIPRTGNSYRFLRPLVVDEETRLTFRYRRR